MDVDSNDMIYNVGHFGSLVDLNSNITIRKTNSSSNESIWNKIIDDEYTDRGFGITIDSNDCAIITGSINFSSPSPTGQDIFVAKYDSSGNQLWNNTWGGSGIEDGFDVVVDSDDNVYIVGTTNSFGVSDSAIILLKYNSTGDFKWNESWDSTYIDWGYDIDVDKSTGAIYIVGYTSSPPEVDAVILKYNSSGDKQWEKLWDGDLNVTTGHGIKVDLFGNIYVTGESINATNSKKYLFLVKFDSQKNELWNSTLDMINVRGNAMDIDCNNDVYVTGTKNNGISEEDVFVGKWRADGNKIWNMTWGTTESDYGEGIILDSQNYIYITGRFNDTGGGATGQQFILKLMANATCVLRPPGGGPDDDNDGNSTKNNGWIISGYNTFIILGIGCSILILIIKIKLKKKRE